MHHNFFQLKLIEKIFLVNSFSLSGKVFSNTVKSLNEGQGFLVILLVFMFCKYKQITISSKKNINNSVLGFVFVCFNGKLPLSFSSCCLFLQLVRSHLKTPAYLPQRFCSELFFPCWGHQSSTAAITRLTMPFRVVGLSAGSVFSKSSTQLS